MQRRSSHSYFSLPPLTTEIGSLLVHEEIFDTRVLLQKGRKLSQILVKWTVLPHIKVTWGNQEELEVNFPNFNLEDKVNFDEGGNAMIEGKKNISITHSHEEKRHVTHDPNHRNKGVTRDTY